VSQPIITLTTDYGTSDALVGSMKGAILKINPEARIVDICHDVLPFDVLDGALTIAQAYAYFPPRTIHAVVVDPGVGSARRPILATTEQHYFVAPDNGVLSLIYEREPAVTVRCVTARHYFLEPVSDTFHGRDVFGPVAAWLSRGWQAASFGDAITDYVRLRLPQPQRTAGGVKGVVLKVDRFGNLMTNLTPGEIPQLVPGRAFCLRIGHAEVTQLARTYAEVEPGEPFLILGSAGFFEVSVNRGSAARLLGAQRGAEFELAFA